MYSLQLGFQLTFSFTAPFVSTTGEMDVSGRYSQVFDYATGDLAILEGDDSVYWDVVYEDIDIGKVRLSVYGRKPYADQPCYKGIYNVNTRELN